jgi:hypothetical protein
VSRRRPGHDYAERLSAAAAIVTEAAVTEEPSAPEIPNVPAVEADQVEKWVFAVPAVGAKVIAVMFVFVLVPELAAFQVQACRVEVASEAPVAPGSAVLSCTNAMTLTVPPERESSACAAAVGE